MSELVLSIIRFYQRFLSPVLPRSCRFQPSCSYYAYTAIERYGARIGYALAVRRVLRCHPFNTGGYDPVPESRADSGVAAGQEVVS